MTLHSGTVPDGAHPHRVLFNTDAFYALRDAPAWHEELSDGDDKIGEVTFHTGDLVSGWSAPFGGIDWRREYWRPEQIVAAVRSMRFGDFGSTIRCKPTSYGENEAATLHALLSSGWFVDHTELNYSIEVPATLDVYERTLSRQAIAAIDRGDEAGLVCGEIPADRSWEEAYEVLRANREDKGRPISLTLDYVLRIREAFGPLVRMLGCYGTSASRAGLNGRVVAAALVYRVGRSRDVVQFWGDSGHGLAYSPMNLLVRDVVDHAIRTGAKVLDLGISTEGGEPNGGLCRFKRSVGARAEPRFVLRR